MSKAKKIISMLLAVLMVFTMAPVSGLAALADDGYEYVTPSLTPTSFSVDTTATTEVTRIAAGTGMFSLPDGTAEAPNTIVSATPSGVPQTSGTFSKIAYAGETPSYPKLVFKITGAVLEANPTIIPSSGDIAVGPVQKSTSGSTTTYTYEISGNGASLAAGTDLVYEIEYVVNGVKYTAYAYSHIENIIIMGGFISYRDKVKSSDRTRQSSIGQLQSANMYTRMNGADLNVSTGYETDTSATSVSNRVTGYINYAAGTAITSGALSGCGSETDLSTATDAYGSAAPNNAIAGTEQPALIKSVNDDNATTRNMCTHNDTNRSEPVIYLDATDTLQSINLRFTLQNAELSQFTSSTLNSFRFLKPGIGNLGDDVAISDEIITDVGGTLVASSEFTTLGMNYGSVTTIPSGKVTEYAMAKFGGTGPAASSSLNDNYTLFCSWNTAASGNGDMQTTAGINVIFRKYDTRDLRALYNGMMAGNGSTYACVTGTYSGTSVTFNRGVNPRAEMYVINSTDRNGNAYASGETDWTMFEKALNTAGSLLARPDLNQTQIDNAVSALYNAYYNLEGYSSTYYVEIHHVLAGTNTPIVINGTQLIQKVNGGNPVASGQTLSSAAAQINGYKVVGDSVKKTDISGKLQADGTNKLIVTYTYEPETHNITINPNNGSDGPYMLSFGYAQTVDLTAKNGDGSLVFNYGTKDGYVFAGWKSSIDGQIYDVLSASGTKSFVMPREDLTLVGQWKIAPVKVIGIPVTNKGVVFEGKQLGDDVQFADETSSVTFAQPTKYVSSVSANGDKTYVNGQYLNEGYLFGGYYETYNAETNEFSNPVSWPLTFSFGDTDKTVYIRWVDVNGTVSFDTNGGSVINDITYNTTPAAITAPANPTKLGYDFVGWFADEALTTTIKADDGSDWTAGKVKTQQTQTGFLAYAKWEAQDHTITFNMGTPTSAFDTTTNQMPTYMGKSDAPFDDILPATPTKYGKIFTQWVIEGTNTVYNFDYYPKEDIVLTPVWNNTKYSAFISIGAYEKLATGEATLVEPTSQGDAAVGSAQAGDVVTFRMTSLTNFYVGSSVFVFMYDKNFYDLVADGTSAFVLNSENEYVAGIEASAVGITNDATMSKVWPAALEDAGIRADYNAMMVTIDPTVTSTNFNCEPMSDGTWLVEFKLRVKDTATEGDSGTVYMSNEWTRTAENIMGTMFYGWAETGDETVADTYNHVVTPNLDTATATIQIDPTPVADTTVYLNPNGGAWADGSTETLEYTGREATEITGFAAPAKDGYNLKKDENGNNIWYKYDAATGTVDETVVWVEGYYATAETNGLTFVPAWEGIPYTVNYYVDMGGELWDTEEVIYGEKLKGPFYEVEKSGYEFVEWQDADGNVYVVGESTVPAGGVDLYAQWIPGMVDFTVLIHYYNKMTSIDATATKTLQARAGSRVELVETAGTDENVTYVLWSSLTVVNRGYIFDSTDERNDQFIEAVNGDGSSVLNVYYKAMDITITFDAGEGGTFPSTGTQTFKSVGAFYDPFDITTIEEPVKEGYVFDGWSATNVTAYQQDRTITAKWKVKQVPVEFNAGAGTFGTTNVSSTELNYGSTITAPTAPTRAGYDFLGWAATEGGAVLESLGTATDYNGHSFYAVWAKAKYALTYTVDGALYASEDVEYESTVTIIDFPADITGYTFVGWDYDGTMYAPGETFVMPEGAVEIIGYFEADTYDAVFNGAGGYFNGDEAVTSVTVATVYDKTNVSPAKPVRNGYEFLGWTLTEGSSTIDLIENGQFTMDAEGKTYYAVWKATYADYFVEYYQMDTEGNYPETATSVSTMTGSVEGEVSAPLNAPTGFTVDTDASEITGVVTPAPENLVLKVYYKRNLHTITWVDNAGTTTQDVYYGATIVAPTAAEKVGYTFTDWQPAVDETMPDADRTYTATYGVNQYPVTFNAGAGLIDGASTKTISVEYGKTLGEIKNSVNPVREGYELLGWALDGTSDILVDTTTVPVDGFTLVAVWEIQSFTVNFRGQGGTYADGKNLKSVEFEYGAEVVAPEIPARVGYTFTGWKNATSGAVYGVNEALPSMGGTNVDYQAQWTQETYTVNFVIDGTTITNNYVYGATIVVPDETETVKDGYTFMYWTDASGAEVEIPEKMADLGENGASVTYTAYFEVNKYTVTWNVDGSKTEVEYNFGATIVAPADPAKTGYTFAGWSPAVDATMPANNVTYTAQWTVNNYTVTWVLDNGSEDIVVTYAYGANISKIADPAKEGHTFAGWSPAVDATMPANNVTYTAQWTTNYYTVEFKAEGVTVETKSYAYGAAVDKPSTDPSKEGYTFVGWKAADGTVYGADATLPVMVAADVEYTAEFVINTYSVTWDVDGATTTVDYNYGATVAMAAKPSKTGYTFSGWKYSKTGEIFADGAVLPAMIAENVTYTAQWNIDSYTVTFVADNATIETKSYEYGAEVAKPADPVKTGYSFIAWVAADGTEYAADADLPAMGTENVTYTAKFEINQYTVLFDALDGVFANGDSTYTIKQNYNTMATKPADPTQTGYTFKGWTTIENGQVADIVVVPATWYMEASDTTYYAVWVINSYTVTFYADNEGTVAYTTTLEYGEEIKEPAAYDASFADPALANYTFEGWSLTEVELGQYEEDVAAYVIDFAAAAPTVPAEDIEIYPVFARIVVALAIPEGSTAQVLKYEDDTKTGYITGLEILLDEDTLLSTYLAVEGDGRLEVTLTKYGVCGTGTKVEVIDNVTDLPVETYFLIIYGDVNGDADIDATDASMVYNEAGMITMWSNDRSDTYDYCKVVAADIYDHDGLVSAADATAISDIALWVADVNQIDGIVEYYYL